MKYIDSEKLIVEIERKKEYALEHYYNQGDIQSAYNICCEILSSIDSLQQEQLEVEFEVKFAEFLERKDAELGAKSWSEDDLRELALYFYYGRNDDKQPEVDLEKEIRNYNVPFNDWERLTYNTLEAIARHFYALGLKARKKE